LSGDSGGGLDPRREPKEVSEELGCEGLVEFLELLAVLFHVEPNCLREMRAVGHRSRSHLVNGVSDPDAAIWFLDPVRAPVLVRRSPHVHVVSGADAPQVDHVGQYAESGLDVHLIVVPDESEVCRGVRR